MLGADNNLEDKPDIPAWLLFIIAIVLTGLAIMVWPVSSSAQGNLREWFNSLQNNAYPNREFCCYDFDGIGVDDLNWKTEGGKYYIRRNAAWEEVPEYAVLKEPNRAGRAIVWYRADKTIRCFLPGVLG